MLLLSYPHNILKIKVVQFQIEESQISDGKLWVWIRLPTNLIILQAFNLVFCSIEILNLEMIKGVHLYLVIKDLLKKIVETKRRDLSVSVSTIEVDNEDIENWNA